MKLLSKSSHDIGDTYAANLIRIALAALFVKNMEETSNMKIYTKNSFMLESGE
jgi:hypothetical protein